ncbi:aminotransferase class I/II-fold pyridoxal phosphate-dependent enzyme [Tessaracoccus antarcticus]|nr:aminotransferase class I/II-fold pyridoxal phosphate-dependent enzyme [Tessaracoccus antarcticus]
MHDTALILLSAATERELRTTAGELAGEVERYRTRLPHQEASDAAWLQGLSARTSLKATQPHRAAVLADSLEQLHTRLCSIHSGEIASCARLLTDGASTAHVSHDAQAVFLYPGQGSQRVGESSELAAGVPRFAAAVRDLEERFTSPSLVPFLSGAWGHPLDAQLQEDVNDTTISQPLLSVLAIATTETLADLGVHPSITLGHSVGEIGALHGAGVIDSDTALGLIQDRVFCMRKAAPASGMIAVRASAGALHDVLEGAPGVFLSCDNGPHQVVLGGTDTALHTLERQLDSAGVRFTRLHTSAAFHTPLFATADAEFRRRIAARPWSSTPCEGAVTCVSSVTARNVVTAEQASQGLGHQLSGTVRFREAARKAQENNPDVLVQLSGGVSLMRMYRQTNPEFTGREIGMGGSHDTRAGMAACVGEMFLSFHNFQAHKILNSKGIASMTSTQAWTSENSVVRTLIDPPLDDAPSGAMPPAAPPLPRDVGGEGITQDLLGLFREQIATLSCVLSPAAHPWPRARNQQSVDVLPAAEPNARESTASPAAQQAEVSGQVTRIIADIGGYNVSDINTGARLGTDLGFDSLTMTNVHAALTRQFPAWKPSESQLGSIRTIDDLARTITGTPVDDEHPARPSLPARTTVSTVAMSSGPVGKAERFSDAATPETGRLTTLPDVQETVDKIRAAKKSRVQLPYYVEHQSVAAATTTIAGEEFLSFSSYNYLGLAGHPHVVAAVHAAVDTYGTSCSAARILSGNRPIHNELERSIASLVGAEDSVVLVGGHGTNASIIPLLYGNSDVVFHDALSHDSIHQGIKASGAVRHSFPHNDIDQLDRALAARRKHFRRALIVTEGIFSMDGDLADLPAIVRVARKHGAHIMVDEAHSIGVLGATGGGICEELGVDPSEIDILMGTLSKSMASCGGYIAGGAPFIQHLRYSLSSLVFSAAITPANTAAALAAIEQLRSEPERLHRLRENSLHFVEGARARGLNIGNACGVPVVPVILGDSDAAIGVANTLYRQRISVNPIIYPAVSNDLARLRFFLTSEHTIQQLDRALDLTSEAVHGIARAA